jgi:replicative DNA helicase
MTETNLSCLDVELQLLGGLIRDADRVPDTQDILGSPSDFESRRHQTLYRAIVALDEAGEPVDMGMLLSFLKADAETKGLAPGDGWRDLTSEAMLSVTSGARVSHHARTVARAAQLRELSKACRNALGEIEEVRVGNAEEAEWFFEDYESRMLRLLAARNSHQVVEAPEAARATAEAIRHPSATRKPIATGFADFDYLTGGGLWGGELLIPAAGPGVGKSATFHQVAVNAAHAGHAVLLASLEMPVEQIWRRFYAIEGGIDATTLRTGPLLPDDRAALDRAERTLAALPISVIDDQSMTVSKLRSIARRRRSQGKLGLVIVDYLQLMTHPGARNRLEEVSAISRGLKCLAVELDVPVIALSQFNRTGASEDRPQLHHLRDSGSLEQDSDMVLLLWEDSSTRPDDDVVTLHAALDKNRSGQRGEFTLAFRRNTLQVASAAPREEVLVR